jgi:hypothetical protein
VLEAKSPRLGSSIFLVFDEGLMVDGLMEDLSHDDTETQRVGKDSSFSFIAVLSHGN